MIKIKWKKKKEGKKDKKMKTQQNCKSPALEKA